MTIQNNKLQLWGIRYWIVIGCYPLIPCYKKISASNKIEAINKICNLYSLGTVLEFSAILPLEG